MNLYLISSPFQYICAEEAKLKYDAVNNILVVEIKDTGIGIKQLIDFVDESKWDEVIYFSSGSRTFFVPKLLGRLRKIYGRSFHRFFFSEYTSWLANTLMVNIEFDSVVYFDDGTLSVYEYENYIEPMLPYSRSRPLQDLFLYFMGCKSPRYRAFPKKFEMFTVFKFPGNSIKIVKNSLETLRKSLGAFDTYLESAPVGIIGQGTVGERGDISVSDYIKAISEVLSRHGSCIYFPHRSETDEVKSKVSILEGLEYHYPSSPIEIEIAISGIKLSALYGVASTAMYTIPIIYKELPVRLLKLDSYGDCRMNELVGKLIKHYESNKI